jgi:hypothetical protein
MIGVEQQFVSISCEAFYFSCSDQTVCVGWSELANPKIITFTSWGNHYTFLLLNITTTSYE